MLIQFTLQELMVFLVCLLAITVGVLLIPILIQVKKGIVAVRTIVDQFQGPVGQTVSALPGILKNADRIAANVKETTDTLNASLPGILQDVGSITGSAKGSVETAGTVIESIGSGVHETIADYKKQTGVMNYVHIIAEVLQIISGAFTANKAE